MSARGAALGLSLQQVSVCKLHLRPPPKNEAVAEGGQIPPGTPGPRLPAQRPAPPGSPGARPMEWGSGPLGPPTCLDFFVEYVYFHVGLKDVS